MMAGMYVVHDGTACLVSRIIGAPRGYGQTKAPDSTYELAPVDGSQWRYVRNPLAVDVPLTPACEACELPAGFCAGTAGGQHRTPQPVQAQPVLQTPGQCRCSDRLCGCGPKPGHGSHAAPVVQRRAYRTGAHA